jgi:hypothetical protein
MTAKYWKWMSAAVLALTLVPGAMAQCGLPGKPIKPAAWHPLFGGTGLQLTKTGFEDFGDREPQIVGMWHVIFTAETEGSQNTPIPRQISSAVSAVLRCENFSRSDAAGAEQCGYGDLR